MPAYQLPTGQTGGQGDPISPTANNPFLQQIMGHPGYQGATQSGLSAADTQALAQFVNSQPGGAQYFSSMPGFTPQLGEQMLQKGMSPQQFQAFMQSAMQGGKQFQQQPQAQAGPQPGLTNALKSTQQQKMMTPPSMTSGMPGGSFNAMQPGGVSKGYGGTMMPLNNINPSSLASFGKSNPFTV
jgi:hypothetical protein